MLPPAGQYFCKCHLLDNSDILPICFLQFSCDNLAEVLPLAGLFFMTHPFVFCVLFWLARLRFFSRGLAGILPPAVQIFEK